MAVLTKALLPLEAATQQATCTMTAGLANPMDGGFGGGMQLYASCTSGCRVDGNSFISNSVPDGDGGGMYASAPKALVVINNLFEDNQSGEAAVCSSSPRAASDF